MAPIQSNRIARLAHTPKKFLAFGFTSGVCGPLYMCSICAVVLLPSCLWPSLPMRTRKATGGDVILKKKDFSGLWKSFTKI